jgi:hypothetical protein
MRKMARGSAPTPGTEIAWRHFVEDKPGDQKMTFYRIDTELKDDIALDDVGSIGRLREYGERLAEQIDWEEIFDGTDEKFRVRGDRTSLPQYAKETI